jgi:membrane protein involved in colicin uptake
MSEIEQRLKALAARFSEWWGSSAKAARERRAESSAQLRREAKARAHQAASRVQDFRESERGQQAASKLSDLRTTETAKRAEAALKDLRTSETAKKAESALADLRQREPVKKAEEGARKVLNDLFSGSGSGSDATGDH